VVTTVKPVVTILGGGYAGLRAALQLHRRAHGRFLIRLVDHSPAHQLITRLPEVVGGRLKPERCSIPFARLVPRGVEILHADILEVDFLARRVDTSRGRLTGDWFILALGSTAHFEDVPGAREYSFPVRSVTGAWKLHLEIAGHVGADATTRIVIVGGGYTATEVAGELADWNLGLRAAGVRKRILVTIVNDVDKLLPAGNARLGEICRRFLASKGTEIRMQSPVSRVERDRVVLTSGEAIPADIVIWGARSRAAAPGIGAAWRQGPELRAVVDEYLRGKYERLYVAGDSALTYDYLEDRVVAATAQFAVQEGEVAADNVYAEASDRQLRVFHPHFLGEALSLGRRDGVADAAGVIVTGRAALGVKQAALLRYLRHIGGARLVLDYA